MLAAGCGLVMPMSAEQNRQWRVRRYPRADEPIHDDLFEWTAAPVPEPADGQFVVRTLYLAPGPAQRGYLNPADDQFLDTVPLGEVMRGRGFGRIVASRHPDYPEGRYLVGSLGWQDYALLAPRGADFVFSNRLVDDPQRPLSTSLGILGQAGVTAYYGLLVRGELKAGDVVLVSAAAGGVGSVAGQLARINGASRVIGIAGGAQKCAWLVDELGFHAAIDYRADDVGARLAELAPGGVDLFFDCVGGDILNTGLDHLAMHARVMICGFISTDYDPAADRGPINYRRLLHRRARMEGFVVFDYWDRWPEAERRLRGWYRDGSLVNCEHLAEGLEAMPAALASLFSGGNRGIRVCRVADEDG